MVNNTSTQLNTNKGFTLVELIVVLALMAILLGITIFGALGWIDWTNFQAQDAAAEDIFYAAQNQLTELDSSGALARRIRDNESLWDYNASTQYFDTNSDPNYIKGNYKKQYVLAQGKESVTYGDDGISFNSLKNLNGESYIWYDSDNPDSSIWKDNNRKHQKRTILKLVVAAGRYDVYKAKTLPEGTSALSADERLLFDLIAPYIADKSILNGAIALEFSPEAAQVFAVCYSNQKSTLSYTESTNGSVVNIMSRKIQDREKAMLGYYGVDSLTPKVRGRGKETLSYRLEIVNEDSLNLKLGSITSNPNILKNADLEYVIYGASTYSNNSEEYPEVMKFSIPKSTVNEILDSDYKSLQNSEIVESEVEFSSGLYNTGTKKRKFRFPVWSDKDGNLMVALDAADIQAQSVTYADIFGLLGSEDSEVAAKKDAFSNTYSFYRFGLPNVRFIRAEAHVKKTVTDGDVSKTSTGTALSGSYVGDNKTFVEHEKSDGKPHGVAVTFADPTEDDEANETTDSYIYGIANGRHLYNVRFESDYSTDIEEYMKTNGLISGIDGIRKTFVLKDDIDWNVFTGITAPSKNEPAKNSLLNSYMTGENPKDSGINIIAGSDRYELAYKSEDAVSAPGLDTSKYPFPGFRQLSYGDTFKQEQDLSAVDADSDTKYFKISNLSISFAANCIYGIYGKDVQTTMDTVNASVTSGGSSDYSELMTSGRQGFLPLGLFAENFGTIEDLEMDDVTVKGVEGFPMDNPVRFLATSKVGGYVGENFGTVEDLYVDEYGSDTDEAPEYNSSVSGRSDVGGIVGHQYYKASDTGTTALQDVTIRGCKNRANVSGISYVGGVIGRIYPSKSSEQNGMTAFDSLYTVGSSSKHFSENYISPSETEDFSKADIGSFTIDNCKNRGDISLNSLYAQYSVDGTEYNLHRGFYFGGITGAAFYPENTNNASGYTSYTHNNDSTKKVVISNCDSCILYDKTTLKQLLNPIGAEQTQETNRRLRANFVGGIVGGIRYAYIINCSTTPGAKDDSDKYSFVFGDRYVGGVAGYSLETDYSYDAEFRTGELAKISNGSSIQGPNYNIINGTGAFGNYAIGGVAGCFGTPDTGDASNASFVRSALENALKSSTADYNYPVNSKVVKGTNYKALHLLNTSVVLGHSFDSNINKASGGPSDINTSVGRNFYAVGGVTGLLAETIEGADFIQTEEVKNLNLELISMGTTYADKYTDLKSDSLSVEDLQTVINDSFYVTDGVGGIAGHAIEGGNINAKNGSTKYKSRVDAIVFGRNRVGGGVGDTVAYSDGKSTIANVIPSMIGSSSTGLYVLGYENVGGVVGAFSDNGGNGTNPTLNSDADYDGSYKLDKKYHVIGYRAVGGLIGTFYRYKNTNSNLRQSINVNIDTNNENSKTVIKGAMYVGAIAGIQEAYSAKLKSDLKNYKENARYKATVHYVKVDAECFAGLITGALFSNDIDKEYWPVDLLLANSGTLGQRSFVESKIGASFVSGIYAYNRYSESEMENSGDMSVLYNKYDSGSFNSNYKIYKNDGKTVSCNGLYNLTKIRDFKYDSQKSLLYNVSNVKTTYDQDFKDSTKPVNEKEYMDMTDLSNNRQQGSTSHCFVTSAIYAGGFSGYIPKNTFIKVKNYKNRAVLWTYDSIKSHEAGAKDDTDYSYMGGVSGKIPVGMVVNNCWNTSEDYSKNGLNAEDRTGQHGFYNSKKATYKGGVTEVNAGRIENCKVFFEGKTVQASIARLNAVSNYGKGAFAGVNGTIETDGINSGVIADCRNTYANGSSPNSGTIGLDVTGHIAGGVAAVAGGSSKIVDCYNQSQIYTFKQNDEEGQAGGILGKVMECLSDSANYSGYTGKSVDAVSIILENNVNNGDVRNGDKKDNTEVNNLRAVQSAGIVYDSQGLADIINCRNYSEKPKYAITSTESGKTAKSIKYCFDASGAGNADNNITNKAYKNGTIFDRTSAFGTVSADLPSDNMRLNFFVGNDDENNSPEFEAEQSTYFAANKFYINGTNMVDGSDQRIDNIVFSDGHTSGETARWAPEDDQNHKLAFEILPAIAEGTAEAYNKNVYADIDSLSIDWDNYYLNELSDEIDDYYDSANLDESEMEEAFTSTESGDSIKQIAEAEYSSHENKPDSYSELSEYISSDGKLRYFYSVYLLTADDKGSEIDEDWKAGYISNLYKYAHCINSAGSDEGISISYSITLYDILGKTLKTSTENESFSELNSEKEIDIESLDGTVETGFDRDKINRIVITIEDSTAPAFYAGNVVAVRSFKWRSSSAAESSVMNSVGVGRTLADPFDGKSLSDTVDMIYRDKISLTKLYKNESDKLMLNGNVFLDSVTWDTYSEVFDTAYEDFINSLSY